jgi:hypothetical protein
MKSVNDILNENLLLNEKLITFGGQAYPKFGNVVILAGGGGSGKGFIIKRLLGIEGNQFNVDDLKSLALRSTKIKQKVKDDLGIDISDFSLKNSTDVSKLHDIINSELNLPNKRDNVKYSSILTADTDRKPNLIFDTTLGTLKKLHEISRNVQMIGYDINNIHIVWVINDFEIAKQQNAKRSRVVPEFILDDAHRGTSVTMKSILDMEDGLEDVANGDIWFVFNNIVSLVHSDAGGSVLKDIHTVKVKSKGDTTINIEQSVVDKVRQLVPKTKTW